MKLLLVGSSSKYAIERPYLHHFSQHPDVSSSTLFAAQNQFLVYYNKSTLNKILYRTGLSTVLRGINDRLIKSIQDDKPDIVFIFKGMEIFPKTLRWMRGQGVKLVNYNPDNPFIFTGRGSGNKNVRRSIALYDLHFTYDRAIGDQLEKEFRLPVHILPFGFEISKELYERCTLQEEVIKACFLGNPDKARAQFICQLADAGVSLDVYGSRWEKIINHKNVSLHGAVYDDEFWLILSRYRIQLNLMRVHNPDSHNMRTFEIPGVGGIQLAPDTPDHRAFFQQEKEIFLYQSLADCVAQVKKILASRAPDIKAIRNSARERCVNSGYTYRDRANHVISVLKTL